MHCLEVATSEPTKAISINQPNEPSDTTLRGHARRCSRRRITIVTRRFWPYSGSTELMVADLASAIHRAGHHVDVLTIRWNPQWPARFQFLEFPVERINRPASSPWGSFRYLRNLMRRITELQPDGMIVFGLGEEAWAIAKSIGGQIPIVIRLDPCLAEQPEFPSSLSSRNLVALRVAEKILVESQRSADRLRTHSAVSAERIQVVPDGVHIHPPFSRSLTRQKVSRVAISDAHPMLMVDATQPLVICGSPMDGDEGLIDLIEGWSDVLNRFPQSRLWMVGEGTAGRDVWDKILENNFVSSVIMPGSFDDLSDLFQAADIYIHPLRSNSSCSFLTRAMAAGVCPVVTSTEATRGRVQHDFNGLVVGSEGLPDLASTIMHAVGDRDLRDRIGRAALKSAASEYDIDKLLDQFLDPLLTSDDASGIRETDEPTESSIKTNPSSSQ